MSVTGVVKSVRKDRKGFQLEDGEWYSAFNASQLKDVERGNNVAFDVKINGKYKNIQGNVKVTGNSGGTEESSDEVSGFPIAQTASSRAINRQNALTNAVTIVGKYGEVEDVHEAADLIIEIAQKFEYYTTGDMDFDMAKEALAAMTEES